MIWLPGVLSQDGNKVTWGRYSTAYGPKAGTAATVSRKPTYKTYAADTYTISGSSFKLNSPTSTEFQNLKAGKKTLNISNSNTTTSSGSTLYEVTNNSGVTSWTQSNSGYGSQIVMRSNPNAIKIKGIRFDESTGLFSSGSGGSSVSVGNVVYTNDMTGDSIDCSSFSGASQVRQIKLISVSSYEGNYEYYNVQTATISAVGSDVKIDYTPYTLGYVRGDFIETVRASEGTYPDNGKQGDYWYVRYSDTPITWERYAVSQTAVEGSSTRATGVYNKYLKVGTEYSIENGEFAVTTTQSLRIRTATSSITAPYTILADGTLSLQSSTQTTGDTVRGPMLGKLTQIAGSSTNMYANFIPYTIGTSKGSYIDTVESFVPDEYPDDGIQDGYWYVKIS